MNQIATATGISPTYLGLVVDDLAAATTFYRDTLGLKVDEGASVPGAFTQFEVEGGAILALQAQTELPDRPAFELALQVDDVEATYRAWSERGVELIDAPNDQPFGRTFIFRTPDGHVMRAYQPDRG